MNKPEPVLSPAQHARLMTLMREKPALTQEDINAGHAYAAKRSDGLSIWRGPVGMSSYRPRCTLTGFSPSTAVTDVSIQVVASTQSREFLLATLDHKIAGAKASLDLHRANADQAVADGTPIMEQHALACAQANSDALDWLLERRFRLSSEAL